MDCVLQHTAERPFNDRSGEVGKSYVSRLYSIDCKHSFFLLLSVAVLLCFFVSEMHNTPLILAKSLQESVFFLIFLFSDKLRLMDMDKDTSNIGSDVLWHFAQEIY